MNAASFEAGAVARWLVVATAAGAVTEGSAAVAGREAVAAEGRLALILVATTAKAEHSLLDDLLQQHRDLFEEPQGLPPARIYDHRIHLLPGSAPVAVRPYRYPQLQKDELERQCAVMLTLGIIRISTSPFSAPVLLVRKAGGDVYCTTFFL